MGLFVMNKGNSTMYFHGIIHHATFCLAIYKMYDQRKPSVNEHWFMNILWDMSRRKWNNKSLMYTSYKFISDAVYFEHCVCLLTKGKCTNQQLIHFKWQR